MGTIQRLSTLSNAVLLSLILAGLLVRRRISASHAFTAYALAVLASEALIGLWPKQFFAWGFYLFKETVHDVLKFAIAVELMVLIFGAFPTAKVTIRRVLLAILISILVVLLRTPLENMQPWTLIMTFHPWILDGTAVMFAVIFGFILWYRIPLHPVHKAILFGFIPYLLLFTVTTDLLLRFRVQLPPYVNQISGYAYIVVLLYWARVAWRRPQPPPGDPATIQRIQPWLLARTGGMW